jgi:predicted nucleotidyltransferase
MITEHEKDVILRYAEKYNVGLILLFGSSIEPGTTANDVDLGVKGIDPALFFKFYGELVKHLSKPVDLVDLSHKSLFNDLVEETGLRIYEGPGQKDRGGEGKRRKGSAKPC